MSSDVGAGDAVTGAPAPGPTEPVEAAGPATAAPASTARATPAEPDGAGAGAGATGDSPADRVAAAVLAVPGVHALHAGVLGEAATYLPGRRVAGVRVQDADSGAPTEVHIVLDWDSPALVTADAVRSRVEQLVDGPVHVVVEDITAPTTESKDI